MTTLEKFMSRCFDLAVIFATDVKTNPMVGALLEYEGKIIGEGAHERFGSAHAEVNAIQSIRDENKHLIAKSTLYVTLEPCFHFGKTPPCVQLILDNKIPKVVISCTDPNPKVAGQSINLLRERGVNVVTGILEEKGKNLIRPFLTNMSQKRPYVILKYAQSQDGFLGKPNEQIWLTNSFSKRLVHRWRSEADAILIGKNTAIVDNPQLTNRLYFGKNPIRILIDKNLEAPKSNHIYDKSAATIVPNLTSNFTQNNIIFEKATFDKIFLTTFLRSLYDKNIGSIIVEGGAATLQHFIDEHLWDEARVFTANTYLHNGIVAPQLNYAKLKKHININSDILNIYVNVF
jgi:diaminohydroxyphosphoribosylaminopyrimidine deaminase / 5-amino-6-(5-phosphoribosylamino)uracil reductase